MGDVMPQATQNPLPAGAEGDLKARAVSSMLWVGGLRLASRFSDQVFTVVLARLLLPSDFGIIAMVSVFTRLFNLLAHMGLSQAVIQRSAVDDDYLSTAFWASVANGLVLTVAGVAVSGLLADFYGQSQVGPVFAALALRFVFGGIGAVPDALFARGMRFGVSERRGALGQVLGGGVGVALAIGGAGVWSLVGQAVVADGVGMLLLWTATSWRPRRVFRWTLFTEMWAFGSRMLAAQFFNYVVKYADNLLIGKALGAALLGYYAFAYTLFLSPLVEISLTVGRVTFATLSRLQDDAARFRRGFQTATVYVAFLAMPALVGLALVAPDLIGVVFGAKWLPAVPVLRILLAAGLLQCQAVIWNTVFPAAGRMDWFLKWCIFSAFVYVGAFVLGLRWGITGVAAGYTVAAVLLTPLQFALVQRIVDIRFRDYLRALRPVLGATAVMGAGVMIVLEWITAQGGGSVLRLLAGIAAGVPVYLLAIWVFDRRLITNLAGALGKARARRPARRWAQEGAGS